MVLSNVNLSSALTPSTVAHIGLGYLKITPLLPRSIQPASIDLHLDSKILVEQYNPQLIKPGTNAPRYDSVDVDIDHYILEPGQFILGSTIEKVSLNNTISGLVAGKSSLARCGLTIATGFIDPGFNGTITLEIFNVSHNRIELTYKMGIAQLVTSILVDPATMVYGDKMLGSKYQNQEGVTPTRVDNDD